MTYGKNLEENSGLLPTLLLEQDKIVRFYLVDSIRTDQI